MALAMEERGYEITDSRRMLRSQHNLDQYRYDGHTTAE